MPLPKLLARTNKHVFNRFELKWGGKYPVLNVVGRSSGRNYRVPIEAHAIDGGFVIALMYGPNADWVQNVMAAGSASLDTREEIIDLDAPEIIDEEQAWKLLPPETKPPPAFAKVDQYLRIHRR